MEMEDILREIAENEGFSSKAKSELIGAGLRDSSNFHGSVIRGVISEENRELSVFIKKEIPNVDTNSRQKFCNEVHFYTKILPQLKTFGNVPTVPRYLWSTRDEGVGIIALEDITAEGYRMPIAEDGVLSPQEVQLVLQELEKLHETSKTMKEKNPALFEELGAKLEEGFCVGQLYEGVLAQCYENAIKSADAHLPPEYRERLERFDFTKTRDWTMKRDGPGVVFTHGDSWSNNFMFKYEGDTPTAVAIVDWQMCRLGSPLLDVSELLLSSSSGRACPAAPECSFGFAMAITILPFMLEQANPSLALTPEKLEFSDNPVVAKRIADVVRTAVDSGII